MAMQGGLYWVFWQLGFDAHKCRFLEREFDRLRLCNLGADDWAGLLLHWKNRVACEATLEARRQIERLMHIDDDIPGQMYMIPHEDDGVPTVG